MIKKLFVVAITFLLLLSVMLVMDGAEAIKEEDEVEVPKWNEGYRWRYRENIPVAGVSDIETEFEKEVTDESSEVNVHGPNVDGKTYETYQVRETHNPDDPDEKIEIDSYQWKENLAEIYNDPEYSVPSAYHPPIVELDFPLSVGKEWDGEARYFEDPGDPEKEPEPDREYEYMGKVEDRTVKEIDIGEFETYMVNLTVLAYDPDEEEMQLHLRYEMYYSPEVKNVVHTDIFEKRRVPEEDEYLEEQVGEETLVDYNLETDEREPVPDLMIHDLTFSPENITVNDEVTISVNVTNIGDLAAESIETRLKIDGELLNVDERFYQDGEEIEERVIEAEETVMIKIEWQPEDMGEKTVNLNITDAEEPEDLRFDNKIEDTIYIEEEDDDTPGFSSTLLLLAAIIAVAIYKKKKR